MEKTDLTPKLSKNICEMIEENKPSEEIRKACGVSANTFRHWIEQAVLLSTQDLDPPLAQLRNAIIARVLKDTAILGMLKAASEPSETKSYKTTLLSELSKSDKALLEQQGYTAFIKKVGPCAIILKVEETCTSTAPDRTLFKEILKATSGDADKGITQKLMPFNRVHPDLPPV